jgi:acetylornithine deacetylase/succinyl-diaminopimelate desuccinylase-like protein
MIEQRSLPELQLTACHHNDDITTRGKKILARTSLARVAAPSCRLCVQRTSAIAEHGAHVQVTPSSGRWWGLLSQAVHEAFVPHSSQGQPMNATMAVAPTLLSGRTDSAKFEALSDHGIYRFVPWSMNLTAGDPGLVHGIDERLHVNTFVAAIQFYTHALQLLSSGD